MRWVGEVVFLSLPIARVLYTCFSVPHTCGTHTVAKPHDVKCAS